MNSYENPALSVECDLTAELARVNAQLSDLRNAVEIVATSCAFVVLSLPKKQRPAIQAIADELYAAHAKSEGKSQ